MTKHKSHEASQKTPVNHRLLLVVYALCIMSGITIMLAMPSVSEARPGPWKRAGVATWYGPGFYGGKTACGQRYSIVHRGVASNSLRCGTLVEFHRRGARVIVPVTDTGGFGHTFDLSAWTAMQLCGCRKPETLYRLKYRVLHSR